jgi:hypothetical protein
MLAAKAISKKRIMINVDEIINVITIGDLIMSVKLKNFG